MSRRHMAGAGMNDTNSPLPRTEREIAAAAKALGLPIPDACLAGVMANLALLDRHTRLLRGESAPA